MMIAISVAELGVDPAESFKFLSTFNLRLGRFASHCACALTVIFLALNVCIL
jgi:hypothetical protein